MAVNGNQNNAVSNGATQSRFRISLTVEGNDWGVWDKMSGGGLSSAVTTYRPGGLAAQVALTGSKATDDVTLERLYDLPRDHANLASLLAAVGGGVCVVKLIPLDKDANAFGEPIVWSCILKTVTPPPTDSNSDSAATIVLVLSVNGAPTA